MSFTSSADVFGAIGSALKADPSLGKKVKGVIRFVLTGPKKVTWTVDTAAASVTESSDGKASVTITISDKDFMLMAAGKLTGMAAFMGGKMKIAGDMGLAQKFGTLTDAAKKSAGSGGTAAAPAGQAAAVPAGSAGASPPAGFGSNAVFEVVSKNMASDPSLVKKVNGTFAFSVTGGPGGATASWWVDCKSGSGAVVCGAPPAGKKADCTITMFDADLMAMAAGKLTGMAAFMGGKMKIKGNMALAQKLGPIVTAKAQSKL